MEIKTCSACGISKPFENFARNRSAATGRAHNCRTCAAVSAKKYRLKNIDIVRAKGRAWHADNRDRAITRMRLWKEANKERHNARQREKRAASRLLGPAPPRRRTVESIEKARKREQQWARDNPARMRINMARHRAGKLKATPTWLTAIQFAQIEEFYEVAVARSAQTGTVHHVDHIHPLMGRNFRGLHVPWNLQVLTGADNQRKHARLVDASLAVEA